MHGPPAPDNTVATISKSLPPQPPLRMSPPIPPPPPPPPPFHLSNFSQVSQSIPDIQYPQDETEKESTQREIVKPEYTTPSVSQSSIY